MKKLDITSKAERHAIYELALLIYHRRIKTDSYIGLCSAIADACMHIEGENGNELEDSNDYHYPNPYSAMDPFIEIVKHKPKERFIYWFDPESKEGVEKRISILEQAIKETE